MRHGIKHVTMLFPASAITINISLSHTGRVVRNMQARLYKHVVISIIRSLILAINLRQCQSTVIKRMPCTPCTTLKNSSIIIVILVLNIFVINIEYRLGRFGLVAKIYIEKRGIYFCSQLFLTPDWQLWCPISFTRADQVPVTLREYLPWCELLSLEYRP